MRHLFLALSRAGWGETVLGIRIAKELQQLGDDVSFIAHDTALPLFARETFSFQPVSNQTAPLLPILLEQYVADSRPHSIVLSDFYTASLFFQRARLSDKALLAFDIPLIAVDTWDSDHSGSFIDLFADTRRPISDWISSIPNRLIPCPIVRPDARAGVYKNLPEPIRLTTKARNHIRSDIGISLGEKALLFCTAQWQHANYPSAHGGRIAELVPDLIFKYIRKLGSSVHLVHVGPKQIHFDQGIDIHYHWFPSLPPYRFDSLIASCDGVLSLNASATTITKALVSGVPVVVIQNTISGSTCAEIIDQLPFECSSDLKDWLKSALPLYPFSMWPLGYYSFLRPLLADNPYSQAINLIEMLHEKSVLGKLSDILFSEGSRHAALDRQYKYIQVVAQLPSGASLVKAYTGMKNE